MTEPTAWPDDREHPPGRRVLPRRLVMLLVALAGLMVFATSGMANSHKGQEVRLEQCANDKAPSPSTDGCADSGWITGNLNWNNSVYGDGETVPYRALFTGLTGSYTLTVRWNGEAFTGPAKYNTTVASANPCAGSWCSGAGTDSGPFTIWGGEITNVAFTPGSTTATVTFTPSVENPVLAWGAILAPFSKPGAWGHMYIDKDGPGKASQHRSIHRKPAKNMPGTSTLRVVKVADVKGSTEFRFDARSRNWREEFVLVDDGTNPNYRDLDVPMRRAGWVMVRERMTPGWELDRVVCTPDDRRGKSRPKGGKGYGNKYGHEKGYGHHKGQGEGNKYGYGQHKVWLHPGENATCTFYNRMVDRAELHLVKQVSGGTATAADFTVKAVGPSTIEGAGTASGRVNPGTYVLSESGGPGGYTAGAWSCVGRTWSHEDDRRDRHGDHGDHGDHVDHAWPIVDGNKVTLGARDRVTCTIVNTHGGTPAVTPGSPVVAPPNTPVVAIRGMARITGPRGCVSPGMVTTRVTGRNMAAVHFYRNGKLVRRVNVGTTGTTTVSLGTRVQFHRSYVVTARVRFVDGATPSAMVLRHAFRHCRPGTVLSPVTG